MRCSLQCHKKKVTNFNQHHVNWVLLVKCKITHFIIQLIDTLPKYGKKKLSMYVGPHDVYPTIDVNCSILTKNAKIKSFSTIFSLQTLFCYQCVELKNYYSAQACVISPNFSQLVLRPRRLRIKRYHARFRAIMVKCFTELVDTPHTEWFSVACRK